MCKKGTLGTLSTLDQFSFTTLLLVLLNNKSVVSTLYIKITNGENSESTS